MKYRCQWVRVIFMRYCQVPTNTKDIQTQIAYSFYNSCDVTIQIVTHCVDWFSCLAFALLQNLRQHGRQIYILNYMWTAANFIIEDRIRPYGRRLCIVGQNFLFIWLLKKNFKWIRISSFDCKLLPKQLWQTSLKVSILIIFYFSRKTTDSLYANYTKQASGVS